MSIQSTATKTGITAFLALVLAIAVYSPNYNAFAANIVLDVHQLAIPDTQYIGATTVCGITDSYTITSTVHEYDFTFWDNGHIKFHAVQSWLWMNSAGVIVARSHSTFMDNTKIDLQNEKDGVTLPTTINSNFVSICVGDGVTYSNHWGWTVGQDGTLAAQHFSP